MLKTIYIIPIIAALLLCSCDNFLDITPTGKVIARTGEEYAAMLRYEYKNYPKDRSMTMLRSDELLMSEAISTSEDREAYLDLWRWKDDAPGENTTYYDWRTYYHAIYIANYIIEKQDEIEDCTAEEREQLVGEAYMMRGYTHLLLANLYAQPYTHCQPSSTRGVPVMTEADVNLVPRSSSVQAVYDLVKSDAREAAKHLNVKKWEAGENYRFNVASADALLMRASLYSGDYTTALSSAKAVIEAWPELQNLNSGTTCPNSYLSAENICAMEKNITKQGAYIGRPDAALLALYSSNDCRKTNYFKRESASKTILIKGDGADYCCTFRSGEAYITAAEAASRLGKKAEAVGYLRTLIAARYKPAGQTARIADFEALDDESLTEEILKERFMELAFEGHRWFDLRRTTMPAITKKYTYKQDKQDVTEDYTLSQGDARYTMHFPAEAVAANSEIELMAE